MSTNSGVPAPALTRNDRATIIDTIKKLVLERHINVTKPNQDYGPWVSLVDERMPGLVGEEKRETFETGVRELLRALGSSHTAFFHRNRDDIPAPYSINATLRAIERPEGKRWMFVDVLEGGAAFQAGIRPGEFLLSIDSEPLTPPKPASFRIGSSHQLEVATLNDGNRQVSIEVPNRPAKNRPPMVEPRSVSHKILTPNVGLVRVATFPGAVGQSFARTLDGAIRDLKGHGIQRLIVDLRGNVGGGLGSLRLMSYLCPDKREIGYSLSRARFRKGYRKEKLARITRVPATKIELLMMALRFKFFHRDRSLVLVTEGLGSQPFHGRTVVLINEYTHSAAEMVCSFAKENRLAPLVGTRTSGEVLGGANFTLPCGYLLRIPIAGWYTWKGKCIEGQGVEPDVMVENSPESLAQSVDAQLDRALAAVHTL